MTTATEKQITFAKALAAKLDMPIVITGKPSKWNNLETATRAREQQKQVAAEYLEGFEVLAVHAASARIGYLIDLTKGL